MSVAVIGTCAICGERARVRAAVVRWIDPSLSGSLSGVYEAVDRCDDVKACRERIENRGHVWPVDDPRTVA